MLKSSGKDNAARATIRWSPIDYNATATKIHRRSGEFPPSANLQSTRNPHYRRLFARRNFDIIMALAREYRGPHRMIVHRSQRNRHNFGRANEGLPLISGEFLLWLSGDGVAEAEQVGRLVEAWHSGQTSSVWSNSRIIDECGRDLGLSLPPDHPYSLDLCDYADGRFLDFHYAGVCGYSPRDHR